MYNRQSLRELLNFDTAPLGCSVTVFARQSHRVVPIVITANTKLVFSGGCLAITVGSEASDMRALVDWYDLGDYIEPLGSDAALDEIKERGRELGKGVHLYKECGELKIVVPYATIARTVRLYED